MAHIEKRRTQLEMTRLLHFGKIVGPWWRPSITYEEVNLRFANFLQNQDKEQDVILRAAFTCMVFENNRLLAFVPHVGQAFALLRSDRVALSDDDAAVVKLLDPGYVQPSMPFFSDTLPLPESLRPKTVGKMMVWCIEDTDVRHHHGCVEIGGTSSARVGSCTK